MTAKNNYFLRSAIATGVSALIVAFGATASYAADDLKVYGVTADQNLIEFQSSEPGRAKLVRKISGAGLGLVRAIDFRPADGQLYALTDTSSLYTINIRNGVATLLCTLSATLSGTEFDIDFNPTVDRLRIISNTGQNLRANPNVAGGVCAVTVDGTLNPGTPEVTAAAYSNNDNDAISPAVGTNTTLFDIDTASDTLFRQIPPNNGTLVSVGALGVAAAAPAGMDIYSFPDPTGRSIGDAAFALLQVDSVSQFANVDLETGATRLIGPIVIRKAEGQPVIDIAIAAKQIFVQR